MNQAEADNPVKHDLLWFNEVTDFRLSSNG